ncbi:MAG: hypothetical protein R6U86_08310 [Bacteroidales bacterium]
MKRNLIFVFVIALLLSACGPATQTGDQQADEMLSAALSPEEEAFLDNLASLCGQSFRGRETYMAPGRESWGHLDFVMHVTECEEDHVYIPFHLSDDTSRTWMFVVEDGRLRFRHDHRHPDGTPEESTLYGGYSDGSGTAFRQYFPADDYTVELLQDTIGRQWNIVMDEAMTNFSYQLQYEDEIIFQADFDLTNPL